MERGKLLLFLSEWVILIIVLFNMVSMNSVPLQNIYYNKYLDIYQQNHNQTDADIESVVKSSDNFIRNGILIYSALSVIVMLAVGPLSDRYGRKFGILWTVALTGS